jgi:hypothetical protein
MLATFKTKDDFLAGVSARLDAHHTDPNIRSALVDGISAADEELRNGIRGDQAQAFHLQLGAWVIRDDDVPLFEGVNSMAAAVTLSLTSAGLNWPAVAAALAAIANICWRVWRKGARLTSRQISVYGFLKANGPMRIAALTAALNKAGEDLSEADVASTLKNLAELELNDGQIIALASEDATHEWKGLKI